VGKDVSHDNRVVNVDGQVLGSISFEVSHIASVFKANLKWGRVNKLLGVEKSFFNCGSKR
jgi:hypothetical protein